MGEKNRRLMFRSYGWTVATVGILALIFQVQGWPFPFTHPKSYGIFPNTNHMSNWLAVAGILLTGTIYADIRKKQFVLAGFSLLAEAAILTCLAANSSRGGLGIFFLGLILWAVAQAVAGPEKKVGILLLAATALAGTFLLYQGAKPLERIKQNALDGPAPGTASAQDANPSGSTLDFRLLLQRDAIDLTLDHPWLGVGPGNFPYFFPPYRQRTSGTQSTAVHPESDWVWIACEYGWPAVLALLVGSAFLLRQARPGRNREGWITRSAGLSAVLAFGMHGLVDVPGHRVGTVWPILMVMGLICARKSEKEDSARPWEIWLFRAGGILLTGLGLVWIAGIATDRQWPATVAAERAKAGVASAWQAGDVVTALAQAEKGLAAAPYDQVLRFLHGKALLFFEDSEKETTAEFAIQSRLEPFLVSVPLDQAAAWIEILPAHPELALPAYQDALRRALEFQSRDRGPEHVLEHMNRMALRSPGLRPLILPLIEKQPRLLSPYLTGLPAESFPPTLAALLAGNPDLEGWSRESLGPLIVAWARKGDTSLLVSLLEKNTAWKEAGWPVLAQLWVKAGRTKEALELVEKYQPAPALPDDPCPPNQAESRWYRSPRDYGAAYVLSETRRKNGDLTGARVVLEKITERPETPAYFWWLRSRVEAAEGRDTPAWESLRKYLEKTVPGWPNI